MLNPLLIEYRYPDDDVESRVPTYQEFELAAKAAREIFDFVVKKIKEEKIINNLGN